MKTTQETKDRLFNYFYNTPEQVSDYKEMRKSGFNVTKEKEEELRHNSAQFQTLELVEWLNASTYDLKETLQRFYAMRFANVLYKTLIKVFESENTKEGFVKELLGGWKEAVDESIDAIYSVVRDTIKEA